MAVTAFLSLWINNSAATSIMIPAAIAIIDELQQHEQETREKHANPRIENRRKSKDIIPVESTSRNLLILII
jgi:di/tricarboxylate transporter